VAVGVSALADARRRAEGALRAAHAGLERRVAERTRELAALNESLGHEVSERRAAELKLVEHQARLQDLASEVVLAEQRERRRIAERLHDDLAQLLALCQIRVGALRGVADAASRDRELAAIEDLVEEAVGRARSITCELSPPVLYELGLEAAIQWLAGQLRGQTGASVTVLTSGGLAGLSEEANITLFQIARELLANVAKHAGARKVELVMTRRDGEASVIVQDDGVGFEPGEAGTGRAPDSFGLFSIRERLRRHGGALEVQTEPGGGTRVAARLPLPAGAPSGEGAST
jgi:signal transduction histidine kinase